MKWISINEFSPELGKWVLVRSCSDYNEKIFHVGKQEVRGNLFEVGNNPLDYYGSYVVVVTHWMPLPESPNDS